MATTLKHEIKTEFLLDKGIELLWSKGYNATSVNDIVKAAGIPKGSFYFYFENKEDFAIKSIDRYFTLQFGPQLEILTDTNHSAKQRILNLYDFRYSMLKDHLQCQMGCMGCNISNEMSEHSENIRKTVLARGQWVKDEIIKVALEAQKDGDIKEDVDVKSLVDFIEDAAKGVMITMKETQDSYPVDNYMMMIKKLI